MKFKILCLMGILGVYFMATFCMLNGKICKFYSDYYLLRVRTVSWEDEIEFTNRKITKLIDLFRPYFLSEENPEVQTLGFTPPNSDGRWTNGNLSKIAFQLPEVYSDVSIFFNIKPYINNHNPYVIAKVYINGKYLTDWEFKLGSNMPNTEINLAYGFVKLNPRIEFTFILEGMASPKDLGYGNDNRKIGLFFKDVLVMPSMNSVPNTNFKSGWKKNQGASQDVTK